MVKLSFSTICAYGLGIAVSGVLAVINANVKGIQFQGSHYVFSLTDYGVCREYNQEKWDDINKYEISGMHCYSTPDALEYHLCVFRKQDGKSPCALQEAQCRAIDGVLDPGEFCHIPLPTTTDSSFNTTDASPQ